MAGQSAMLTKAEACAMQERVQASGSHAKSNGGGGKKKSMSSGDSTHRKNKGEMHKEK